MKELIERKSEIRINIRVPESEKLELQEVAKRANITETLIVRHALKQALTDIKKRLANGEGVSLTI